MKEKMKKRIVRSQNLIQVKLPITIPNGSHSQGIAIGDFRKFMKNRKANLKSKLQNRCKSRLFADHFKMVSYLPPFHTHPAKPCQQFISPKLNSSLSHSARKLKTLLPFSSFVLHHHAGKSTLVEPPPPRREEHSHRTTSLDRAHTSHHHHTTKPSSKKDVLHVTLGRE
ncbi:Uncharacterized protein Fot_43393 [Forsythia ovata]|uniref:Uncharacterized protein n=1 Tax=Forsythia ovata TaxID=205694 RepID=A0ABD1RNW9_9LAMI